MIAPNENILYSKDLKDSNRDWTLTQISPIQPMKNHTRIMKNKAVKYVDTNDKFA